jgi:hypothetical protein
MDKNTEDYGLYWDKAGTESETDAKPSEPAVPRPDPREAESAEMSQAFNEPDQEVTVKERSEPASFAEAFKAARDEGKKSFTWQGKSYSTQLKKDVAAQASASAEPKKATVEDVAAAVRARSDDMKGMK